MRAPAALSQYGPCYVVAMVACPPHTADDPSLPAVKVKHFVIFFCLGAYQLEKLFVYLHPVFLLLFLYQ